MTLLQTCKGLSEGEALVIFNELNTPVIKWLNDVERWDSLVDVWTTAHMLTGCIIFPRFLDKEKTQANPNFHLQLKMLETFISTSTAFKSLTIGELRHAFFLNNQGAFGEVHKHYNRELNAEFVGCVLIAYCKYKKAIYNRYGNDLKSLLSEAPTPTQITMGEAEWMHYIQLDYENWCVGYRDFIYCTPSKYLLLRRCGGIRYGTATKWLRQYQEVCITRQREAEKAKGMGGVRAIYREAQKTGAIPRGEHEVLIGLLHTRYYHHFLDTMLWYGVKNIFTDTCNDYLK